jgi:hypothetical protein
MAQALLEKEVLNLDELEGLLGKRPYNSVERRNIDIVTEGFGGPAEGVVEESEAPAPPPPTDDSANEGQPALASKGNDKGPIAAS